MAGHRRRTYTEEDKARVFIELTVNEGNVKRTARNLDMPISTVRVWKQEWAKSGGPSEEVLAAATAVADEFVETATRIRDKALLEYESLVQKGEVKARDLVMGIGVLTDKINVAKGLSSRSSGGEQRELPSPEVMRELAYGAVRGALEAARERDQEIVDAEWSEQADLALPVATTSED